MYCLRPDFVRQSPGCVTLWYFDSLIGCTLNELIMLKTLPALYSFTGEKTYDQLIHYKTSQIRREI